ncbi:hypothetical protein L7F22_056857 [Adiantum nelumboides]|nr:hypothetical protein [Adiantum nelumboides]
MEAPCSPGLSCSICLCDSAGMKDPVVTCCGHLFCWACVYRWASIRRTCPLCKGFLTRMADFTPLFIGTAAADDVECPNSNAIEADMPPRPAARRNHKELGLHELAAAPPNQQQIDAQNSTVAHDELGFLYPPETEDDHILSTDADQSTLDQQYDAYAAQDNIMTANDQLGSFHHPSAHDEGDPDDHDNRADGQHSAHEPNTGIGEMLASVHRLEQHFEQLFEILSRRH